MATKSFRPLAGFWFLKSLIQMKATYNGKVSVPLRGSGS